MWEDEGIAQEAIEKYNIRYYPYKNKIIIPHFDPEANLIGIRVRNIEPEDLLQGKYMPAIVGNKMYSHPLSFNLYGLEISKDVISKGKKLLMFLKVKSLV